MLEGRFIRNLRALLVLVICLGTVQYLLGSYVLNQTGRETSYVSVKVDVPVIRQNGKLSEDEVPHKVEIAGMTAINIDVITTSLVAKVGAVNVTQMNNDVKIFKVGENVKRAKNNVTVKANMTLCDVVPPGLGPFEVNTSTMYFLDVEEKYPEVLQGGHYKPANCTARHKVAILVPYRDRPCHLSIFLNNIHPFLMKQQIEYRVFVVEQRGLSAFNRAKLFNVGAKESNRFMVGGWQCFIFHDVDLLPLDTRNMYTCPKQPRHMSAAIDTLNFKLPFENMFGGVSAMTAKQFNKVNGFSNKYWGWGGEDDDMAIRLKRNRYHIARYKMSIARYTMLAHKKAHVFSKRYQILLKTRKKYKSDGLSTLRYRLVNLAEYHLYTLITANLDEILFVDER